MNESCGNCAEWYDTLMSAITEVYDILIDDIAFGACSHDPLSNMSEKQCSHLRSKINLLNSFMAGYKAKHNNEE